ncbi:cation-translocating P-type ATPase [Rheinheimera sp. 4Y26]|uniref:cation-translocating P-type ATPase n=1 Tax=Rheinheimera sp. 4Y26 TaxID=2977811 RepID=UPI0021B0A6F5|nr:cation-translocating P-type ATPase [Rheinheimera sp. 4Y26]MCT6700776.1 cation-translocating P-type ATPase [Rheinheimera sp. 4Y26]
MPDNHEMPQSLNHGLSTATASRRLRLEGPNELPQAGKRPLFRIVLEVLREPMFILLLAGGLVYLLLGDLTEAVILLIFASFSVVITVLQESRSERVLEALRDLSSPRAQVIRDGVRQRIAGREVVREDLLVLEEGDRIAADAILIQSSDLQVDESLLTGESMPVGKVVATLEKDTGTTTAHNPGGEGQPYVYSGSLVVRGSALARVLATGARTEIGKIGQSLSALDVQAPRLRSEISRIVLWFGAAGALAAALVVLLYGLIRGEWLEAVLAGIAIGMSLLPEEFPVVLAVFMAMGAWRIGKAGVLTRRAAAIETLGSATVLCTDKTGTLTQNRMALAQVWLPSGESLTLEQATVVPLHYQVLIKTATLASAVHPSDPMEMALHKTHAAFSGSGGLADGVSRLNTKPVYSYGLRPELAAMSNIWLEGGLLNICAKGAPEAIIRLCRLSGDAAQKVLHAVEQMASQGIRVLAVATATAADQQWAESQLDYHYSLSGLVGFADPIRETVPAAIAECRRAGIRVVMITGDYAATAQSIASQAGIEQGRVLTGDELNALDERQLAALLKTVTVFARIMPQQKLRIVQAFKASGEVVAMTGDGVNDAPSLKAAHIGVAMGGRGTDVAREASALVLLNDDFSAIVQSARLGRRIYDNIRKAMAFILAVHVPIAGLALLPLFFGLPMLLGPIHIALLEMVIDPVCALVFEAERPEDDVMDRPPRDPAESMFSPAMLVWSLLQGTIAFAMLAAVFLFKNAAGAAGHEVRALVFFGLIAQLIALILVNRSFQASLRDAFFRKNKALRYVLAAVGSVTALVLILPQAQQLLMFGAMRLSDMLLALSLGVGLLLILESCKYLMKRMQLHKPKH